MSTPRILVVDDEPIASSALQSILAQEGYEVREAKDGESALALLESFDPDVVLSDVRMPRMDGLTLLRRAKEQGCRAHFALMTASARIEAVVEAMRAGAENYLLKPLDVASVLAFLQQALAQRGANHSAEERRGPKIIGSAPELQRALEMMRSAAASTAAVLVLGESGTGKDLFAQALHEISPRRDKPFIKVSCATLPKTMLESELFGHEREAFAGALSRKEGRLELARGGTLFLDEIADLGEGTQLKLVRLLEQHEFERLGGTHPILADVRIVAATHRDLAAEVKAGRFREDLFYRLSGIAVTLPPLRQRKSDIPALAAHFIDLYAHAYEKPAANLTPGALQALLRHDWPGNVRELEHAIERAVVLCETSELRPADLPPLGDGNGAALPSPAVAPLRELEREAILHALEVVHGSTSRAAKLLGISPRKIQYRLREYATDAQAAAQQQQGPSR